MKLRDLIFDLRKGIAKGKYWIYFNENLYKFLKKILYLDKIKKSKKESF